MPRLAIVISAVGSFESMETTLVSVLENKPSDCEIVVALRRPYADPYDMKDEVQFIAPRRRQRAMSAVNSALATVRAPYVHLLASGCQVTEGWTEAALARFGDRRVAAVAPWVLDAEQENRLFAAGIGYYRSGRRYRVAQGIPFEQFEETAAAVGPGAFAGFYRKAALDFVGGFCPALGPRQADADLSLAFKHAGFTLAVEPRSQVWATAESDPPEGALSDATAAERLFWRNHVDAGPTALLSHLGAAAWDVLRALPSPAVAARFLGHLRGCLELGSNARHRRALQELSARALPAQATKDHVRIDGSHEKMSRADSLSRADLSHARHRAS